MKALIEEYGHAILVFLVVIALIAIMVVLLSTEGPVQTAFSNLITTFFTRADSVLNPAGP